MKKLLILAAVLAVASTKPFEIDWSQTQPIESIAVNSSLVRPIEDSDQYWARVPAEMQYLRMPQPDRRIVNGQDDNPGRYFALLEIHEVGKTFQCGGSILNSNLILTAAHCVWRAERGIAIVGSRNRNIDEPTRQIIPFAKAFYHAHYTEDTHRHNIAIVRLSDHITFNDLVDHVWLPNVADNSQFTGRTALVFGFGKTCDNCDLSDVLLYAENSITSNEDCLLSWQNANLIQDQNICMSIQGDRTFCSGDIGGPLVIEKGEAMQIGIASFYHENGCQARFPSVFTRITTYLDWILHVLSL